MDNYKELEEAVMRGDIEAVSERTRQCIEEKVPIEDILNKGLIAAFEEIGRRWDKGEVFIPEVLRSAKAIEGAMIILRPIMVKENVKALGTIIIGTVKDDVHDIGKNIVKLILEGVGFEVIDLGVDVPAERFVAEAKATAHSIIGMSALLSTTLANMRETTKRLRSEGVASKIIVGGAPVTRDFAEQIGAAYATDALEAVEVCKALMAS
jgi:5-methyltetrahydrofolate--homocysteine methyltransferase